MKNKLLFPVLIALSLCSCNQGVTPTPPSPPDPPIPTKDRSNPCLNIGGMADPCIIRSAEDNYYYIFTTECSARFDGETYEKAYIPIMRSKDMIDFEYVGPVFENRPSWNPEAQGVWAPDVIRYNNQYYCYYTMGMWGSNLQKDAIGVATTSRLDKEWTDHGKLISGTDEPGYGDYWKGSCMDACVVEYESHLYLFFGSFAGIYYIPLSDDGLSIKEGATATLVIGGSTEGKRTGDYEGAYIRKMNGKWYLMGSHGSCCDGQSSTYGVYTMVSKTDSPFGPYVYYDQKTLEEKPGLKATADDLSSAGNLVIAGYDEGVRGNVIGNVAGPGHNALFQDDADNWWILYHGYVRDNPGSYATSRILFYDKISWDAQYEIQMPYVQGVRKYASTFDYGETTYVAPAIRC